MDRKIIILVFCMISHVFYSQKKMDTLGVIFRAKMELMSIQGSPPNKAYVVKYMEYTPKYTFLESKGFEDVIFFQIHAESFLDTSELIQFDENKVGFCEFFGNVKFNFVFGYNLVNGDLYKLKGFRDNDIIPLILYANSYKQLKRKIISKRKLKNYSVENLDLFCLYKNAIFYYKNKRSRCKYESPFVYDGENW